MIYGTVFAGSEEVRHNFYNRYNPFEAKMVYSKATPDDVYNNIYATGDQVAVNGFKQKTIQINGNSVKEYVYITVEGRLKDQVNSPQWVVLDVVEFGTASADTSKSQIVDVTETVDFLRIGMTRFGTYSASAIDVEGLFTNLDK